MGNPDVMRRDWIVVPEAAVLLGVSDTMVRRLARTGRVRAEDAAGTWLLYRPSVLEYKAAPPRRPGPVPAERESA